MYYVGNLYLQLSHLPAPPQSKALTKTRVALLKKVPPKLAPILTAAVHDPISSSLPYNPPLPSSPAEKLWASLLGTNLPYVHHSLAAMPNTPPIPGTTAIMAAARNLGSDPKIPDITFCRLWEFLMHYTHMVDATPITPIWFKLATAARDDF